MAVERTIFLKGFSVDHHDEGVLATGQVPKPGMAIEMKADGTYCVVHSTQAESLKRPSLRIVKEDAYQGKTINDAYVSASRVFFATPQSGDHLLVLVKSGADIDVGDILVEEAADSGLFVEKAGTESRYRMQSLEDTGGALGADTLVKVEVL